MNKAPQDLRYGFYCLGEGGCTNRKSIPRKLKKEGGSCLSRLLILFALKNSIGNYPKKTDS